MKSMIKQKILLGLMATPFCLSALFSTGISYAEPATPLVWRNMEMTEKTEPVRTEKAEINAKTNQPVDMVALMTSIQQQSQQNMAMILAALQQPKATDTALLTSMQQQQQSSQQQQQQFMTTLLEMQKQNQQNMMLMIASMQQNKTDPAAILAAAQQQQQQQQQFVMLMKLIDSKNTDKAYNMDSNNKLTIKNLKADYNDFEDNSTPTLLSLNDTADLESYVPYQRKRLAPIEEEQPSKAPTDYIAEAVQDAALEGYYKDSMALFTYADTALYKIYCKEGYLTVIRLQKGETVTSINGGDTTRWVVDHAAAGSGANAQTQIMLKPIRAGIDTNLVITTDKHTYQIQAKSTTWYNPIVSWTYPQEEKSALYRYEDKQLKEERETITLSTQHPEMLNFSYKVSSRGSGSEWQPKTVFDDGRKVYIKMPESIRNGEAPALVLRDKKGKTIIVNYRMKNEYYIVDRLFREAELRLGTKDYVRIKRVGQLAGEE